MDIASIVAQINALSEEIGEKIRMTETQINRDSLKINDIGDEYDTSEYRIKSLLKRTEGITYTDVDAVDSEEQPKNADVTNAFAEIEEELKAIVQIEEKMSADSAKRIENDKKEIKNISKKLKEVEALIGEGANEENKTTNDLASVQLHFRKEKIPQ